ncbi:MAG: hypothetical protein GEU87_11690 [Alphaproteobacteria bacterium]|nr:hypothetical protein [Alphaproteobacteria bacterium]
MSEPDDDRETLRAKIHAGELRIAEINARLAYNTGQMHAVIDGLRDDPEHVELLRARAWAQAGATTLFMREGKIVGMPPGWPEGVSGDEFVAADIARRKEAYGPATPDRVEEPDKPSPAVERFRRMLG